MQACLRFVVCDNWAMRLVLLLSALAALSSCGEISPYDATYGQSPSSLNGSQGGGGIQTDIWSNNPGQKTLTNENPEYGP